MTEIILCGAGGKMGRAVIAAAAEQAGSFRIVAGVDAYATGQDLGFPVYRNFSECDVKADVIVDFSRPEALAELLSFAVQTGTPAVLASTGYSPEHLVQIEKAAQEAAIFKSANLSLGVNLLAKLCRKAAAVLSGADIEIVEKHHNKKVDAPSGTALLLADAIKQARGTETRYVFGRSGTDALRALGDIGIHAVRGGNIAGEHEVMFIGGEETITLSHTAAGKQIFAQGALRAAAFIAAKTAGLYGMDDLLGDF